MRLSLQSIPRILEISALLLPGQEACIVGGTVRDLALGRPTGDIDLAATGDIPGLAQRIAVRLGGTAFVMDAERDVRRVVVKEDPPVQIDISPLKGSILEDLTGRDFTINAMAVKIQGPGVRGQGSGVIDPFGGMADLEAGLIRSLGREAFTADPLRLLRAFRLAGQLDFEIEEGTLGFIGVLAPYIKEVSPERVRDELYLILEGENAAAGFSRLSEAGLLERTITEAGRMKGLPQGEPHVHDLLKHSLKAMEYAEKVLRDTGRYFGDRSDEVADYLRTPVDGGLRMSGLVKLAAFLHDVGKPDAMTRDEGRIRFIGHDEEGAGINAGIAVRLKMSTRAADALSKTTRWHMRPLHLSQGEMTKHALFRYVRDMGEDLPASLIVALADAFATRDRPDAFETDVEGVVKAAAGYYYGEYKKARAEPLVRGQDLIDLGLKPGPVFRRILDDVEEKRAEGLLSDREAALAYVKENLLH